MELSIALFENLKRYQRCVRSLEEKNTELENWRICRDHLASNFWTGVSDNICVEAPSCRVSGSGVAGPL